MEPFVPAADEHDVVIDRGRGEVGEIAVAVFPQVGAVGHVEREDLVAVVAEIDHLAVGRHAAGDVGLRIDLSRLLAVFHGDDMEDRVAAAEDGFTF